MLFTAKDVVGRRLCDRNGQTAGRVTALYRYPPELKPPGGAAAVTKGLIVRSTHLVDLREAVLDGDTVVAAYPIALINAAPNHCAMIGNVLSDRHAAEVLHHYRGRAHPHRKAAAHRAWQAPEVDGSVPVLTEAERRQLHAIERTIARQDPRLAKILTHGESAVRTGTVGWLVLAAVPTVASAFVHVALALLVGGTTVVVVTLIALIRA